MVALVRSTSSEKRHNCPQNFHPKITDLISKFKNLENLYNASAGVSECYTVGEHTTLVLNTADKFEATFRSKVENLISWDKFLTFLALHDIGKGPAKEKTHHENPFLQKEAELQETRQILEDLESEFTEEEMSICLSLLRYDTIGSYLKDDISLDEAFRDILTATKNAGIEDEKIMSFLDTMVAFHSLDAASYPKLMQNCFDTIGEDLFYCTEYQNKVNDLCNNFEGSIRGELNLHILSHNIKVANTAREEILGDLVANTQNLQLFLKKKHIELLEYPDNEQLNLEYENIIKNLTEIFLYLAKTTPEDKKKFLTCQYTYWLNGKLPWPISFMNLIFDDFLINNLKLSNDSRRKKIDELEYLLYMLCNFRQDYLIRSRSSLRSREITWLHGSQFRALECMQRFTNLYTLPTGRLFRNRLVPFSGELEIGSSITGINNQQISGVKLKDSFVAQSYSEDQSFEFNLSKTKKSFEEVIEILEKKSKDKISWHIFTSNQSVRLNNIRRMLLQFKFMDPVYASEKISETESLLNQLESMWKQYSENPSKKYGSYKYFINNNDYYYLNHFQDFQMNLRAALNTLEEVKRDLTDCSSNLTLNSVNYPVILGSSTLFGVIAKFGNYIRNGGGINEEITVPKAQLGGDIQSLFTPSEHVEKLQKWVSRHGLSERVKVLSFDELDSLTKQAQNSQECFKKIFGSPDDFSEALGSDRIIEFPRRKIEIPVYKARGYQSELDVATPKPVGLSKKIKVAAKAAALFAIFAATHRN